VAVVFAKGEVELKDYFFATRWDSRKIVESHLKVTNKRVLMIEEAHGQSNVQEVNLQSIESVSGGFVRRRKRVFGVIAVVLLLAAGGLYTRHEYDMRISIGVAALALVCAILYLFVSKKSIALHFTLNHQEHDKVYVIGKEQKGVLSFNGDGNYRIRKEALEMVKEIGALVIDARSGN
jgi:hypothetical protein